MCLCYTTQCWTVNNNYNWPTYANIWLFRWMDGWMDGWVLLYDGFVIAYIVGCKKKLTI